MDPIARHFAFLQVLCALRAQLGAAGAH